MQVTDKHYTKILELTYPVWVRDPGQWRDGVIDLYNDFPFVETRIITTLLSQWFTDAAYPNGTTVDELVQMIWERMIGIGIQFHGPSLESAAKMVLGDQTPRFQVDSLVIVMGQLALIAALLQVSADPMQDMVRARERLLHHADDGRLMTSLRGLLETEDHIQLQMLSAAVAAQQQGEPK